MKYQIDIDNPNGSYSQILVQRILFPMPMWNWEELGEVKYLEDGCVDRVEEEILDVLGDADDFDSEVATSRMQYYVGEDIVKRTEEILAQYF